MWVRRPPAQAEVGSGKHTERAPPCYRRVHLVGYTARWDFLYTGECYGTTSLCAVSLDENVRA